MVRTLASQQRGPGSIPGPGITCGLSLLFVLSLLREVFLWVLQLSLSSKNQHSKIPIRSGIRGPQVCQSQDLGATLEKNSRCNGFCWGPFYCCQSLYHENLPGEIYLGKRHFPSETSFTVAQLPRVACLMFDFKDFQGLYLYLTFKFKEFQNVYEPSKRGL